MRDDERALTERARTSAQGFGELYDHFYEPIYAFTYRRTSSPEEAADITAAVFHAALVRIGQFEPREVPLSAWLYRIASHKLADHYRQRYRAGEVGLDAVDDWPEEGADPAEALGTRERREAVNRALAALPERDQTVLSLIFFDDLSREQVAATLGTSVNNVYVWLHRALQRLRRQLEVEVEHV